LFPLLSLQHYSYIGRDGLIGDYDYAFLFKPNIPFIKKERRAAPFFGLVWSIASKQPSFRLTNVE